MADSLQLHYVGTSSFTTRFLLKLSPDDGYRSKLQNTVKKVQPNIHITDYGVRIHLLRTGGEIRFFFYKKVSLTRAEHQSLHLPHREKTIRFPFPDFIS
jgi:hypothetical protein